MLRMPLVCLLVASLGSQEAWARFAPPAAGPVSFRRDRIPLESRGMEELSRDLVLVAASLPAATPESRRALAQAAALAAALDPASEGPGDLVASAESGEPVVRPEEAELARALDRVWRIHSWLISPEAGGDGRALADCMGDVLAVANPERAGLSDPGIERGAWRGWVGDLAAFRDPEPEPPVPITPAETVPEAPPATLALSELTLLVPAWSLDRATGAEVLVAASMTLRGSIASNREGGTAFGLEGVAKTARLTQSFASLETAMRARHPDYPSGLIATFSFGDSGYNLSRNGLALTGTAALLLEGALTGERPAAVVLAEVGEGGRLDLPPNFWKSLRALAAMPGGGRLILPDRAADFLPSLLVIGDAQFFMKREVLLAGSVAELCDLAVVEPEGAPGEAIRQFAELRSAAAGKPLESFLSQGPMRQRLTRLGEIMPRHASARMLAAHGAGSRPRALPRPVAAREIRRALEAAAFLRLFDTEMLDQKLLDDARREVRERLEESLPWISADDRGLRKPVQEVADLLRDLARSTGRAEDGDLTDDQLVALIAANEAYQTAFKVLTEAAGDAAEHPGVLDSGD